MECCSTASSRSASRRKRPESTRRPDITTFPAGCRFCQLSHQSTTLVSRSEVLWRTLITDTASRIPLPSRHPATGEYGLAFRDWLARIILSLNESEAISAERAQFLVELRGLEAELAQQEPKGSCDIPDSLKRQETTPDADNYGTILNFSFHTRLLMTPRGYLGIATTSVRVDDLVWIVPGSRVPLIFRATRPPSGYRLVGGAYIHGFMQGEALTSHSIFSTLVVK